MNKLNKILLVALVVQVGVLVASRMGADEVGTIKTTKLFDKLEIDKITELAIVDNDKKTVVLKKTVEKKDPPKNPVKNPITGEVQKGPTKIVKWVLASAGGYPARKQKVLEFLGKFPGMTTTQPVSTSAGYHRKLEVADDKFQRKITIKAEGKSYEFFLGSSPGFKQVHLRFAGKTPVYAVRDLTPYEAGVSATDWVEPVYFGVRKRNVVALRIKNSNGVVLLSRETPKSEWKLDDIKAGETLKTSAVDSLLAAVTKISLKEPVGPKVEERFGLSDDKVNARLELLVEYQTTTPPTKEGEEPVAEIKHDTVVLLVGAKEGDDYYVKGGANSKFVAKVGKWAVESNLVNKKRSELLEEKKDEKAAPAK